MTQALNFTTKAIADLSELAVRPAVEPVDRQGIRFILDLLQRAQVFVLPDNGALLDRGRPRPEVPGLLFRPPFPVVALEYVSVAQFERDPVYEATTSSKRISLAWAWDGKMPDGTTQTIGPSPDEGVAIASIAYMDDLGSWMPPPVVALVPYDCAYQAAKPGPFRDAMLATGRLSKRQAEQSGVEIRGLLPILPTAMAMTVQQHGPRTALEHFSADLMDEANAYLDLCIALACTNVHTQKHEIGDKLNRARIRAGKPELRDFHTLLIGGANGPGAPHDAIDAAKRAHLRRGHVRRLGPDRVTWVNSCMVRGQRPGFAHKNYAVAGPADHADPEPPKESER